MDNLYPAVLVCEGVADGAGTIRAAVVGQDQLKVRVLLTEDAFHTAAQGCLRIVNGDDDTDIRLHRNTPDSNFSEYYSLISSLLSIHKCPIWDTP